MNILKKCVLQNIFSGTVNLVSSIGEEDIITSDVNISNLTLSREAKNEFYKYIKKDKYISNDSKNKVKEENGWTVSAGEFVNNSVSYDQILINIENKYAGLEIYIDGDYKHIELDWL